ncbi:hypothetical protein KZP23_21330 [Echinicola marina]|uniref:hypothetical protein n=1 Tax=Echinicola marina TaxID=2859768 RepID=UPI001CF62627|nr:hypothetical protein [Echinicola marina]UCS93164.1 hypothetical protein KZP23_21330 [Echinicola marina]
MIIFEIKINQQNKVQTAINHGVMTFSLCRLKNQTKDEITVHLGGYNPENHQHFDWLQEAIFLNDEITIKIKDKKDKEGLSQPVNIRTENEVNDMIIESKLKNYYSLKRELEDKGLI